MTSCATASKSTVWCCRIPGAASGFVKHAFTAQVQSWRGMQPRTLPTGFGGAGGRRRGGARARLNLPARLVLLDGYCSCTVDNLSPTGARVGCDRPLKRGDQGILKRDGLDQFFIVQWAREDRYGLRFDDKLVTEDAIRQLRQLSEFYESDEDFDLRQFGRQWIGSDAP